LKRKNGLLTTGIIGTVVTLVCCFTPVLLILLGVAGLGAFTGYLDFILLPVLAVFVGLTVYAYAKQRKQNMDS
jgi:hypothetical protein